MRLARKGNNNFVNYAVNVLGLVNDSILIFLIVFPDFILEIFFRIAYLRM